MAETLGYQASHSAAYYTPAKKLSVWRTIVALIGSVSLAIIGAVIYAKFERKAMDLPVRGGSSVAAAVAVAFLGLLPKNFGKIRSPFIAAMCGGIVASVALYTMWIVWIHDVLHLWNLPVKYLGLILHPSGLQYVILHVNKVGTFTYQGEAVCGFALAVAWVGEAALVLAAGVFPPLKESLTDLPVCRACGTTCTHVRSLPRFADDFQANFIASIANRDFVSIANHRAPQHERSPELVIELMSCEKCGQTHVLTINRVAWEANRQGVVTLESNALIKQLLITPDEAVLLVTTCLEIKEQRAVEQEADQAE